MALMIYATGATAQDDLTTWNKRMAITLSGYNPPAVAETLTNFQVLVVLSNTPAGSGFNYNDFLSPPYGDLRFSTASNGTPLNYEVETWNTNGQSYVWVQIPAVTDATTRIWAFWGKGASLPASATNGATWSNAYIGVWHMATNTSAMTDSSSTRRGSAVSGTIASVPGVAGNACDFTPTSFFAASNNFSALSAAYTVSAWINMDANASNYMGIMGAYNNNNFILALTGAVRHLSFYGSGSAWQTSSNTIPSGAWKHVAYTRASTTGVFYVDGTRVFAVTNAVASAVGGLLYLGSGGSSWNNPFDGRIDEVRISNVDRGSNWMAAAYQSMANSAFVSYGEPDNAGRPVVSNGVVVSDLSAVATVNGTLVSTGSGTGNKIYLMWGPTDGGANFSAWAFTNQLADGETVGPISCVVTGVPGSTYYYRYYATNSLGDAWANPALSFAVGLPAVTKTWSATTGSDSNWFTGSNWTPAGAPSTGDVVLIDSSVSTIATIFLTNSTPPLGALIISNRVLVCSTWTTTVSATNIVLRYGANITLPGSTATNAMTNRVYLVCSNLVVFPAGTINVDFKGYKTAQGPGKGVSSGSNFNSGGGHGGKGGDYNPGGITNDTAEAPILPGSGGGDYTSDGDFGSGGGVVRIEATNVTFNGTITADGNSGGTYDGGGAGGSIYITCATFGGGTSGVIRARGGYGGSGYGTDTSGGGGRIALIYGALNAAVGVNFSVAAGTKNTYPAGMGTLYMPDTALIRQSFTLFQGVRLVIPGFNSWACDSLIISNSIVSLGDGDFRLTVTNNLTIWSNSWLAAGGVALSGFQMIASESTAATNPFISIGGNVDLRGGLTFGGSGQRSRMEMTVGSNLVIGGGGILTMGGSYQTTSTVLTVLGDLTLTNGGSLTVWGGRTNAVPRYGSTVSVSGLTTIATNSWIYSGSHPTNGGTVFFDLRDLTILAGGGVDATAKGFAWNGVVCNGPGKGNTTGGARGSGGGYGGPGGANGVAGGVTYGNSNAPVAPGSPGGYGHSTGVAQPGGGAIRINTGMLTLNGTIKSTGGTGGGYGGGGSGGGIFITCTNISGSGMVSALGGSSFGQSGTPAGGGGGGRICVAVGLNDAAISNLIVGTPVSGLVIYPTDSRFMGTLSASNGLPALGSPGETGTCQFVAINSSSLTINGSPSTYGYPHPDAYGTIFSYGPDSWITNTVFSPDNELNGQRRTCLGWELRTSGGVYSNSMTTTQAVFKLTENLILTWFWTNQFQLAVAAGPNGSVNSGTVDGWYTNTLVVAGIQATPDSGYKFEQWTGSAVPAGQETNNPLTVVMDRVRTNIMASFSILGGTTKTWNGVGAWENSANWTPAGMPGIDDTVFIQSGTSLLSSARQFAFVTISNGATLMFTNWNASLTASNITIRPSATVTLPGAFTNNGMSNRVYFICTNFVLESGAQILADWRGFATGNGPGTGTSPGSRGSGGGHGGRGGDSYASGGVTNDSPVTPQGPGSGGGYYEAAAGAGGGVVRIDAANSVLIDGTISANGQNSGNYGGGGAGGSVWIQCATFAGTTGVIRANGGTGGYYYPAAAGGGGRISIQYGSLSGNVGVQFSTVAFPEHYIFYGLPAGMGTLSLPNTALLANGVSAFNGVRFVIPGFTSWSMDSMTLDNRSLSFADGDFQLTITNHLTLQNGAWLAMGGVALSTGLCDAAASSQATSMVINVGGNVTINNSMLSIGGNANTAATALIVGGNLTMANSAQLFVYSGTTNNSRDYGALVDIGGSLTISPNNTWIHSFAHPSNGGAPFFKADTLSVASNTGFNADYRGWFTHRGPGVGGGSGSNMGGGGGYGGRGGHGSGSNGGPANGSTNIPIRPGSGGGGTWDNLGGNGGGAIRLEVGQGVTINGTLTANGLNGGTYNGGGSGGSIFIMCGGNFVGSTSAVLRANGANGGGGYQNLGGGGGGRIAIVYNVSEEVRRAYLASNLQFVKPMNQILTYLGTTNVTAGTNVLLTAFGEAGTIVFWKYNPPPGTIFTLQ